MIVIMIILLGGDGGQKYGFMHLETCLHDALPSNLVTLAVRMSGQAVHA